MGRFMKPLTLSRLSTPLLSFLLLMQTQSLIAESLPIIDTHIHYSHDTWDMLPPEKAVQVLKDAGLKKAFVSSSSDKGTQLLYQAAPDLIVPVLRPYRKRGELSTWFKDETVIDLLEQKLAQNTYAGIGEFHIFGDDANLPVMRALVRLAAQYKIFLHAHSDAEAVRNLFAQDPNARILWAHSGFERPEVIDEMLASYPNLSTDLAFRYEHASNGTVEQDWLDLFNKYPLRFMIGTDTYAPERWYYVIDHADWSRDWLNSLPETLRTNIAYKNAHALASWALKNKDY